jgi:hypothetical protein
MQKRSAHGCGELVDDLATDGLLKDAVRTGQLTIHALTAVFASSSLKKETRKFKNDALRRTGHHDG